MAKSARFFGDRQECVTPSDDDEHQMLRAKASAHQKVLSNQSYTLRKRPAILPIDLDEVAVGWCGVSSTRNNSRQLLGLQSEGDQELNWLE